MPFSTASEFGTLYYSSHLGLASRCGVNDCHILAGILGLHFLAVAIKIKELCFSLPWLSRSHCWEIHLGRDLTVKSRISFSNSCLDAVTKCLMQVESFSETVNNIETSFRVLYSHVWICLKRKQGLLI